ncbi:hypothetical protein BH23CHL2_BH23CHL2_09930 [soil metagenome]
MIRKRFHESVESADRISPPLIGERVRTATVIKKFSIRTEVPPWIERPAHRSALLHHGRNESVAVEVTGCAQHSSWTTMLPKNILDLSDRHPGHNQSPNHFEHRTALGKIVMNSVGNRHGVPRVVSASSCAPSRAFKLRFLSETHLVICGLGERDDLLDIQK